MYLEIRSKLKKNNKNQRNEKFENDLQEVSLLCVKLDYLYSVFHVVSPALWYASVVILIAIVQITCICHNVQRL